MENIGAAAMSRKDFGDYKRSARVKGPHGEVEIKTHDTEHKFITSGTSIDKLLEKAIEGYKQLAQVNNEQF